MAKKQTQPAKLIRKNLGLRASAKTLEDLRKIAKARGTSLQGLFDDFTNGLISGETALESRFLAAMPASAVIKTKNHKIVWVNEGYVAIAGARKDLIGKSIGELWASAPSAVKIEKVDETIFKLKHAIVSVETVNDLWGKKLERLRFRFPIRGPSGEVEYMGAIGFDIDQVVGQVEAELKAALVRLDEKTKGKR